MSADDPKPIRKGGRLTARWLDRLRRLILRAGKVVATAPLEIVVQNGRRSLRWARSRPILARLMSVDSATRGFSWVEVYAISGTSYGVLEGGRSGTRNAFEANLAIDVPVGTNGGAVVELRTGANGGDDYRFQWYRRGAVTPNPCPTRSASASVQGCRAIAGATVTWTSGAYSHTETTDANGLTPSWAVPEEGLTWTITCTLPGTYGGAYTNPSSQSAKIMCYGYIAYFSVSPNAGWHCDCDEVRSDTVTLTWGPYTASLAWDTVSWSGCITVVYAGARWGLPGCVTNGTDTPGALLVKLTCVGLGVSAYYVVGISARSCNANNPLIRDLDCSRPLGISQVTDGGVSARPPAGAWSLAIPLTGTDNWLRTSIVGATGSITFSGS